MKTLLERRIILKGFILEIRTLKKEIKDLQRSKKSIWNKNYRLLELKKIIRGFGILHTIIKKNPNLDINEENVNFIITKNFISSFKIETKWKDDNKYISIDFKKIYIDFIK